MNNARKEVESYILKVMDLMDPSKTNSNRYKSIFSKMSDKDFDSYMKDIRAGKKKILIYTPNMKLFLKTNDLYKAADFVNCKIFDRIVMVDDITGEEYTTPYEYIVLRLPVRRLRQYQMHKLSVPESDGKIDFLTGQVVKPDQAASMSYPEMQLLHGKGLDKTILEFMKLRGGDIHAYATMKQTLEETGECVQDALPKDSIPRSVMTTSLLFKCMLVDNNFIEQKEEF